MKNRIYGDAVHIGLVEYLEREAPNQRPTEFLCRNRIKIRMTLETKHTSLDAAQKVLT
jgi:hypothetical protein